MKIRTTAYEVLEGPKTVTVISEGPELPRTRCVSSQYDKSRRQITKTYTVPEKAHRPVVTQRYFYEPEEDDQTARYSRQVVLQSPSHTQLAIEERSSKIVSRSPSPDRQPLRSILRKTTTTTAAGDLTAISTMSVIGTTTSPINDTTFTSKGRTSSRTGVFYFAYGVHLDPKTLVDHLSASKSSLRPVALAKLTHHTWYINSHGLPNLAPCPSSSRTHLADYDYDSDSAATTVYGILYNIPFSSEPQLDTLSSFDSSEIDLNPTTPNSWTLKIRPFRQTSTSSQTNKIYHLIEIESWFSDPRLFGLTDALYPGDRVRAMLYVDEVHTSPGRIRDDIQRNMSAAVYAAVTRYDLDKRWVIEVMGMYGIKIRPKVEIVDEYYREKKGKGQLKIKWCETRRSAAAGSASSSASSSSSRSDGQSRSSCSSESSEDEVVVEEYIDIKSVRSDFY